jgi:serine/threonine protein kinase/tetratricopeptide (TPR) repeat protein
MYKVNARHWPGLAFPSSAIDPVRLARDFLTDTGGSSRDDPSLYPRGLDPALEELIEVAARRMQAGEAIDVDQLAADHPVWAETIRAALAAMAAMAGLAEFGQDPVHDGHVPVMREDGRSVFGDFRIIREVDRGGMGIVYEAEQISLSRRVALKILPLAAALDARALRRFQLEAQVVGLLQHPRIVPVHAVGTFDGVPYFAMQFIEGCSLAWLIAELRAEVSAEGHQEAVREGAGSASDGNSSDLAAALLSGQFAPPRGDSDSGRRLVAASGEGSAAAAGSHPTRAREYIRSIARLGMQAAEALGYAHDQGVVHRDVKPANLLLDRRGDIWVADFGMANVPGDVGLTRTGDLPGTSRYMSPEQASGHRALVDRRTDIYALGATLYELLALRPAVPGEHHQEILRRIAEEEPYPLHRLNPGVPRDLATIIAKAMSKDPARRYETAWHMADDLGRFLEGRPVLARPSGHAARLLRWCRRKPMIAVLTAALALASVAGTAGVAWSWRDALKQRHEAERQRQAATAQANRADAITHFLIDKLLLGASPERSQADRPVTLIEVLNRAAAAVDTSFHDRPEAEAKIRSAIGQAYHSLGYYSQSVKQNHVAYDRLAAQPGVKESDRLRALCEWGHGLVHLSRLDEAEPLLLKAYRETQDLLGSRDAISLQAAEQMASLLTKQRRLQEAQAIYQRVLDDSRAVNGPNAPFTLSILNNLAVNFEVQGQLGDAERLYREVLAARLKLLGNDHLDTLLVLGNLGHVIGHQGRLKEAEDLLQRSYQSMRRTLGPQHPQTLTVMSNLGEMLCKRRRFDEAEGLLKPCLAAQQRIFSPQHEAVLTTSRHLKELAEARAAGPSRGRSLRDPAAAPASP